MKQRIVTGLIAGTLFLTLLLEGHLYFSIFMTVIACIGLVEWSKMNGNAPKGVETLLGLSAILIIFSPLYLNQVDILSTWSVGLLLGSLYIKEVMITLMVLYMIVMVISHNKKSLDQLAILFMGIFYVGYGFYYFTETRTSQDLSFLLAILFMIWATDSGAYFIGKKWGKSKLIPSISPNKTIEGSLGGIICSVVVGVIMHLFFDFYDNESLLIVIGLSILISVLGQFGDLIESAIKRRAGVKDSGRLLPGHGGILDRFDSILFVFIVLHVFTLI